MYYPSIFEESFMDDLWNDLFFEPARSSRKAYVNAPMHMMHTDIQEYDDKYELAIDVPGYKKEEIQAELKDGYLTIEANHEETKEDADKKGKILHRERYSGKCARSFYVGKDITENDISASFHEGVLSLSIPKLEKKAAVEEKKLIAIQ